MQVEVRNALPSMPSAFTNAHHLGPVDKDLERHDVSLAHVCELAFDAQQNLRDVAEQDTVNDGPRQVLARVVVHLFADDVFRPGCLDRRHFTRRRPRLGVVWFSELRDAVDINVRWCCSETQGMRIPQDNIGVGPRSDKAQAVS